MEKTRYAHVDNITCVETKTFFVDKFLFFKIYVILDC